MKNKIKKALFISFVLIILIFLFHYFEIRQYLTLDSLKNNKIYLQKLVNNNYLVAVVAYIIIFAGTVIFWIPVAPPLCIISGFLFEFLPGLLYALIGALIGATISFLLIRYMFKNTINIYLHEQIKQFNKQISVYGMASYLLILQFATVPFFVINALAALGKVPIWIFMWTTFVGSIPSFVAYTLAGMEIGTIESIYDVFSPSVIVVFIVIILIALLPLFFPKVSLKGRGIFC